MGSKSREKKAYPRISVCPRDEMFQFGDWTSVSSLIFERDSSLDVSRFQGLARIPSVSVGNYGDNANSHVRQAAAAAASGIGAVPSG